MVWRSSMAMAAPTRASASTPTIITPSPSHFSTRTPKRGVTSPHDRAQDLQLVHGGFVAVVVGEVGEPAEVDEGERPPDAPVDGDGGELGGVHGPPLDAMRRPDRHPFVTVFT